MTYEEELKVAEEDLRVVVDQFNRTQQSLNQLANFVNEKNGVVKYLKQKIDESKTKKEEGPK